MANLIHDMLRDVMNRGVEKATAIKALRALSSWFGGQELYIPQKLKGSKLAPEILDVMSDAVGTEEAEKIYNIIGSLYGGVKWYVPKEKKAFRKIIADEIMKEYDGTTQSMRKLCRKYEISFTQVYRLCFEGAKNKMAKGEKKCL